NWDWNYGKSPDFNFSRQKRFSIGSIEVHLNVSEGMIKEAKIFGDFFGLGDISDVEKKLVGQKYDKESLSKIVDQIDVKKYFGAIESEELLTLLY
ncbi:lipoate protein ligase C-terminal domain-containing protein, partial [Enterococcus faecium]